MLMGNAAKILQTVAANIDNDVIEPAVTELYDMVMLTDQTGMLRGDETSSVLGVNVAMQRETQRQRQLEFLQITANPIDSQIMGIARPRQRARGRCRTASACHGEDIVPPDEEIKAMMQGGPGGPGGPPGAPPSAPPGAPGGGAPPGAAAPGGAPTGPQGPQTNVVGPTAGAGPGTAVNPAQGP